MRAVLVLMLVIVVLVQEGRGAPGRGERRRGRQEEGVEAAEEGPAPALPVWCSYSLPWR